VEASRCEREHRGASEDGKVINSGGMYWAWGDEEETLAVPSERTDVLGGGGVERRDCGEVSSLCRPCLHVVVSRDAGQSAEDWPGCGGAWCCSPEAKCEAKGRVEGVVEEPADTFRGG